MFIPFIEHLFSYLLLFLTNFDQQVGERSFRMWIILSMMSSARWQETNAVLPVFVIEAPGLSGFQLVNEILFFCNSFVIIADGFCSHDMDDSACEIT